MAASIRAEVVVKEVAKKIDAMLLAKLQKEKIQPLPPASDEVFVRRVYLDIAGRIPTLDETESFLNDQAANKRSLIVDKLLSSPAYVQNMFNYWADVLRYKTILTTSLSLATGYAYKNWLRKALTSNMPYDQMVRELISADGKNYDNGAVGFYIRDFDMPLDNMAVATQIFLGTSMVCAQCHNHPFDKWTQMDYYQMAAHTYGVAGKNKLTNPKLEEAIYGQLLQAKKNSIGKGNHSKESATSAGHVNTDLPDDLSRLDLQKALVEILRLLRYTTVVDASGLMDLRLPHDYQYANGKPKQRIDPLIPVNFSDSGKITTNSEDSAQAYAQWVTSKDNPRFTTVITNRLWKKLMGQAFIEPLDEITDSTVPSNPELLVYLEQVMKDLNYDMKAFLRIVLNTQAYQRQAYTADVELGEQYHFPGPLLRRMTAEQIWDSMVVLYKPDPDSYSLKASIKAENHLRKIEWMDRALNALSPEELKQSMINVSRKQKELMSGVREAQQFLASANAKKDEQAIVEAKFKIRNQRQNIEEAVEKMTYDIGIKKINQLISQGRISELSSDLRFNAEVQKAIKANKGRAELTLEDAMSLLTANLERLQAKVEAEREAKDMQRFGNMANNPKFKRQYDYWKNHRDGTFIRAIDLNHPAPNGHFLRCFGQSDREVVENASVDANISQVLMLLNGSVFASLMNPFSEIFQAMDKRKKDGVEALIDTVYLSLFSRRANSEEKALLRGIADRSDIMDRGDVLWTALNTRQFFFIQ